jgi:hypothetical protein
MEQVLFRPSCSPELSMFRSVPLAHATRRWTINANPSEDLIRTHSSPRESSAIPRVTSQEEERVNSCESSKTRRVERRVGWQLA